MLTVVLLTSSVINLATPAAVSDAREKSAPGWLISLLLQGVPPTLPEAQRRMSMFFDQATNGSGAASAEVLKSKEAIMRAQRRGMIIGGMLQKDLNGDGTITKQELDIYYTPVSREMLRSNGGITVMPTKEQQAEILQKAEEKDFALDTNGDGRISVDEMLQDANKKLEGEKMGGYYQGALSPDKLMTLDGNSDGVVTKDEYLAAVVKAYKQVDTNGDGTLSPQEIRSALTNIATPN